MDGISQNRRRVLHSICSWWSCLQEVHELMETLWDHLSRTKVGQQFGCRCFVGFCGSRYANDKDACGRGACSSCGGCECVVRMCVRVHVVVCMCVRVDGVWVPSKQRRGMMVMHVCTRLVTTVIDVPALQPARMSSGVSPIITAFLTLSLSMHSLTCQSS